MPEGPGWGPHLWVLGRDVWVAIGLGVVVAALFLRSRISYLMIGKLPRAAQAIGGTPENRAPENGAPENGTPENGLSENSGPPDCMVVIPARNEEAFIADAVRSLPPDSVIVVDDHSEDRTAEEARHAGAGVLKAPDLRRGAAGKANACMAGARALTSRWILFADADTRFSPGFLDAAVARAESTGVALLSIYLDAECKTLAERVLAPYLIALFFCGANPRGDLRTVFNGQCLLVRRDGYEFLGGHGSVLNEAPEDVRLAGLAQRHRLKVGIARAGGLGRVRWRGMAQAVERGARRFMIVSPWMGPRILVAALAMAAWPPVVVWLTIHHRSEAAIVFAVLPFALLWNWYWSSERGFAPLAMLALPVAIYSALLLLWRGFYGALSGGELEWKGRSV